MKSYATILFLSFSYWAHAQTNNPDTKAKMDSIDLNNAHKLYNLDIPTIPPDLYTKGFGFFCKQELKFERKNVPLKFRVGNPEYCNYLESKDHAMPTLK